MFITHHKKKSCDEVVMELDGSVRDLLKKRNLRRNHDSKKGKYHVPISQSINYIIFQLSSLDRNSSVNY